MSEQFKRDRNGRLRDECGRFARSGGAGATGRQGAAAGATISATSGYLTNGVRQPNRIVSDDDLAAREAKMPSVVIRSPRDILRGFVAHMILRASDLAIRRDRDFQRQMANDPDVQSPLLLRQYATALLDWSIIPEDETHDTQVEQAEFIENGIRTNMRRWTDYCRHLLEAIWYGSSACNVVYMRTSDGIVPGQWIPIHPDTLAFSEWGQLGLRVSPNFDGDWSYSEEGPVYLLKPVERAAVTLHVFNPTGPDYDIPEEARVMFGGKGMRHRLWYYWLMKQDALQGWADFVARYSSGIRVFRYPHSDLEAKNNIEEISRNLAPDATIILPEDPNNPEAYSFEIMDPGGTGRQTIHADLIQGYLAGKIKEMIIGQSATTEATNTGLGSDVGTRHAETMHSIVKYDSNSLAETISYELVVPMSKMNFGETPWRPRIEFALEDVDSEQWMSGVEKASDMGVSIPTRQVRQRMGIDEAQDGEETVGGGMGTYPFFDDDMSFARSRRRAAQFARAMSGK